MHVIPCEKYLRISERDSYFMEYIYIQYSVRMN